MALILLTLAACSDGPSSSAQVSITSVAPAETTVDPIFQDLAGNTVKLADFAGQRVVLNYWATWCAPCIEEIPSLERAEAILGDENFIFLLASDESLQEIADFKAEHGFRGNFLKLQGHFSSYGVQAVPSTLLYDESGAALRRWLGAYEWDSAAALEQLRL